MANVGSNKKTSNIKKVSTGKINTKNVFPHKDEKFKVEEISVNEALSSRVRRNQGLYNKSSDKKVSDVETKLSNTSQQKFNFESKKIKIEDDMDNSFFKEKKKKTKEKEKLSNEKIKEKKPVSVKVENISMKKAMRKGKKKNDTTIVTMLFLAVVIVFMGVFLIYHFGTFDHSKAKVKYKKVEVVPENIVFLGDSITNGYDLDKYYPNINTVNSGENGNKTTDILDNMKDRVYRYNPSRVFLLIGTNDLNEEEDIDAVFERIKEIAVGIKKNRPQAKLYIESVYPVNDTLEDNELENRNNDKIKELNKKIKKYCKKEKIIYIDMFSELVDEDGNLDKDYTDAGLHLEEAGYDKVTFVLKKYINKNSN